MNVDSRACYKPIKYFWFGDAIMFSHSGAYTDK